MSDSDLFKEAYAILMSARTAIEPSNAPCPELNLESLTRDILVVIDNHGLRHHPDNEFANAFNAFADRKATMARRLGPEERVVRRHINWNTLWPDLREDLAHLG